MKGKFKQSGVTLMEMTVVIGTVALLTALSMPAARTFFNSLGSAGGTKAMIGAALSAARATAIKEHRYAGIRFQEDLNGRQYMIFIVHDYDKTGLVNGFRAVENLKPMKLPDTIGAMDIDLVEDDIAIDEEWELTNATTFSILFSPSGKLVMHDLRVRNRDGKGDYSTYGDSLDDIFNKRAEVDAGISMFYQDDYFGGANPDFGLGEELSRSSFVIYDRTHFNKIDVNSRWSDYLSQLEWIYINPYTGTIISMD